MISLHPWNFLDDDRFLQKACQKKGTMLLSSNREDMGSSLKKKFQELSFDIVLIYTMLKLFNKWLGKIFKDEIEKTQPWFIDFNYVEHTFNGRLITLNNKSWTTTRTEHPFYNNWYSRSSLQKLSNFTVDILLAREINLQYSGL